MTEPVVKVRGYAVVPGQPDEAELTLKVTRLEPKADAALEEVARRSDELSRLLDELDIPERARSTSGVAVGEERDYRDGTYHHRGYRATNVLRVRVVEVEKIGRLMREAITLAHAEIVGPEWRIALDNPARLEACRQAAVEAKRKADAYASALGAKLGVVVAVNEPGLDVGRRYDAMYEHADMVMASRGPEIEIEAGDLDIAAAVEVTFRLEQE